MNVAMFLSVTISVVASVVGPAFDSRECCIVVCREQNKNKKVDEYNMW